MNRSIRFPFNNGLPSRRVQYAKKNTVTTISFPCNTSDLIVHEFFMRRALREAERAVNVDSEVPIGAVIVRNQTATHQMRKRNSPTEHHPEQIYEILSENHNSVEKYFDASAHAELLAMRDAAATVQNWRLINTTLYSTLEPCPMCLSAAQAFRVQHIVYGAPDLRLGACGTYFDLLSVAQHPYHNVSKVSSGFFEEECAEILRSFFRQRRKQQTFEDSTSFDNKAAHQRRYRWWQLLPRIWSKIRHRKEN